MITLRGTRYLVMGLLMASVLVGCSKDAPVAPQPQDTTNNTNNNGNDTTGGLTQAQEIAQYENLAAQLETTRAQFLGKEADEMAAFANRLFWVEYPGFNPGLHSFNATSGVKTAYKFSIGEFGSQNYVVSSSMVVTAIRDGQDLYYRAYAIDQQQNLLGELKLQAPSSTEQKWWAYSARDNDVFYIVTGTKNELYKWHVGDPSASVVMTLEDDLGMTVGEIADFTIDKDRILLIEGGRLWKIDMTAKTAIWLKNTTAVDAFSYDDDGVMYRDASGPQFFSYSDGSVTDIKQKIEKNSYKMNKTFEHGHYYVGDAVRYKNWIVYRGQDGVFRYNMSTDAIKPVLLTPRKEEANGEWLTYKYLSVLDDGTLFIQGLLGSAGSTGADGPIYRVNYADWSK